MNIIQYRRCGACLKGVWRNTSRRALFGITWVHPAQMSKACRIALDAGLVVPDERHPDIEGSER